MPRTFSPPPRVSDPDMHHGTCVTHVPWCMPVSLTSSFLWSWWRGKHSRYSRRMRNPQFYVSCKSPIARSMTTTLIKQVINKLPNHADGLVQESRNSIASALELRLSRTDPSIHIHVRSFYYIQTLLMSGPVIPRWNIATLCLTHDGVTFGK